MGARAVEEETEAVQNKIATINTAIAELENKVDTRNHKLKEAEGKMTDMAQELEALQEGIATERQKALELGYEEQRPRLASVDIAQQLEGIEANLKKKEDMLGGREEIVLDFHKKKEALEATQTKIRGLELLGENLEQTLLRRQNAHHDFMKYIVLRLRQHFTSMLRRQHFVGEVTVDHREGKLSLSVNPDDTNKGGANSKKSLSGGERSFTTISFIMALWESVSSPFRALDEFDVFMDMVNRRISVTLLLQLAREQRNRQFILLTPLKIGDLDLTGPDVRTHVLRAPERGQQTLDAHVAAEA